MPHDANNPPPGSMDNLPPEEKEAAEKGVPGAFGRKDESPDPPQGDKHSYLEQQREVGDPADSGHKRTHRKHK